MTTPAPTAGTLLSAAAQGITASVIRTLVPLMYGILITSANHIQFPLDTGMANTAATAAVTAVISYLWYLLGRLLERVTRSKIVATIFLGFASAPIYGGGSGPLPGLVRTFVPYAASVVIIAAAHLTIVLDNQTAETLITGLLSGAISVAWYLLGRLGETFWSSKVGIILGWIKPPVYPVAPTGVITTIIDQTPPTTTAYLGGPSVGKHEAP